MTTPAFEEVADPVSKSREFLVRGREYLAVGDLHQASEKGWGAASHMTKAVAAAQGWEYTNHSHFSNVLNEARRLTGNARLLDLRSRANELHINYYKRGILLESDVIGEDIEAIAELLALLVPLTGLESGGETPSP